jgi:hypothetical protein
VASEGDAIGLVRDHPLVAIDQPASWVDSGTVVSMKPDAVVFDGEVMSDPRALLTLLKRSMEAKKTQLEQAGAPADRLVVLIAPDEAWGNVVNMAAAATVTGFRELDLVFAGKATAVKPPPSSIAADLAALRETAPENEAPLLSQTGEPGLIDKVYQTCPAALEVARGLGDEATSARAEKLAASLPGAIEACGCQVDLGAARELYWAWLGRDVAPAKTSVRLVLDAPGSKTAHVLDAPGLDPWSKTYQLVIDAATAEDAKPVHLKAR